MLTRAVLIALLSTGLFAACVEPARVPAEPQPGVPVTHEGVTATAVAGGIELRNDRAEAVSYLVADRGWMGLLASCADAEVNCARLGAGATTVVRFAEIYGGESGNFSEARILFWTVLNSRVERGSRELIVRR